MNASRRTILSAGAVLALPAWMAHAFAGQNAAPDSARNSAGKAPSPTLTDAKERANKLGKPLLVILTDPAGSEAIAGYLWGEFFAHATQGAWLDLALVEVVCLPRASIGDARRSEARETSWAVLVETDEAGGDARFVEGNLVAPTSPTTTDEYGLEVRARAAQLAALVRRAILPDERTQERRLAQSLASLDRSRMKMSEDNGAYEAVLIDDQPVRLRDLDRFAAIARFQSPAERHAELALAARMRLFEHDFDGARWHTSSDYCPPCGMGRVAPASRYFLSFYTQ